MPRPRLRHGLHIPLLLELGWSVTGVDISADQLCVARTRVNGGAELIHADATALPFPDGSFDAALSAFTHTDVEDFGALLAEAIRVLRPAASFVYLGPHPCFVGSHSRFVRAEGLPTLLPGYTRSGRYTDAPGISPDGIRARVGAVHLPLGRFLQSFLDAGLTLERLEEAHPQAEGREYPRWLALRARR